MSEQQKKQQTLLREIELRLTNQDTETTTNNHLENQSHHSVNSNTMQQQAPPHLVPINYLFFQH